MRYFKSARTALKQLTHYFSASLIPMMLNLLINPLVSLNMDPKDFAIVGYFNSFSTLISPIIMFYMLHYYNKRYFELDEAGREHLRALLYKALIFFSFCIAITCVLVLSIYVKCTVMEFNTFPYLYIAVMTIPFSGIYGLELADYKMKRNSGAYLYLSLFKGIGVVLLTLLLVVILKWGATGKLLSPFILEVVVFIYLLIKHKDIWRVKTSLKELFPVLKFCWPLVIGAALGYFSNGYDKTLLESLGNVDDFGYYCVGVSIAAYLSVFTSSISSTFQPDTYEAIIHDNKSKLYKVVSVRFGLTLIVVLLFVLLCPLIVKILTAGKYMPAVPYARIAAFIPLTSSLYYVINDYSIAKDKPQFYLITTILGSLLIILMMPIFINKLSYSGGALMNVLSFIILICINWLLLLFDKLKVWFGRKYKD